MSLDISLRVPGCPLCNGEEVEVFFANITHNLTKMAAEAGIYEAVWRPEEIGIAKAQQLVEPLTKGLALMKSDPEKFKKFDPENKWGSYEVFVPWLERYLEACQRYPEARISIWR